MKGGSIVGSNHFIAPEWPILVLQRPHFWYKLLDIKCLVEIAWDANYIQGDISVGIYFFILYNKIDML